MLTHEVDRQRWSRRSLAVGPGIATLFGLVSGSGLGILISFPAINDFSYAYFLFFAFLGGVWAYILWLLADRTRSDLFVQITGLVTILATVALFLQFPDCWKFGVRLIGFGPLIGCMCALAMFIVGFGWVVVHLVGNLGSRLRRTSKPNNDIPSGGVWDRQLHHEFAAFTRDA